MKKLVLLVAALFIFTGVTCASPLTDYSTGKVALNVTWRPNVTIGADGWGVDQYTDYSDTYKINVSEKARRSTWDWDVTAGLGNKFALQYGQFNPAGTYGRGPHNQDFKLLYQFNNNLSAFTGIFRARANDEAPWVVSASNHTRSIWQGGLVGYGKIADKTNLYGMIGIGSGLVNWEAGIAYEISKNVEFNVSYRYLKVKRLKADYVFEGEPPAGYISLDETAKGIGYGVTFKF